MGSLPAAIAVQIRRLQGFTTHRFAAVKKATAPAKTSGASDRNDRSSHLSGLTPSPRAAAAAVIGMLALGVALGSVTNELAQSAGLATILLEAAPPPPAEATRPEAAAAEPEAEPAGSEPVPFTATPSSLAAEVPPLEEPLPGEPEPEKPVIEAEVPAGLPEVKHVFLIVLGEHGYEETFGEASESGYLSDELPAQGELLSNYFAVTRGVLANEIAMVSGQGPTPGTQADCPEYVDLAPGTESLEGQVEGDGCLYPTTTKTLPGQLAEDGLTWRAYIDSESAPEGEQPPAEPSPGCYVDRRNPFAYFRSIVDGEGCAEADAGLSRLAADLTLKPDRFPTLAYVSPDPAISEATLKTIVTSIEESFSYKDGGLIAITSAQADQQGEAADTSGCCISPDYPNVEEPEGEEPVAGPVQATGGGGRVGALLISPFVEAGTTSETYFNHFSLLATIEELFGLEKIGYAAEPAITGFDESIFNAAG